MGHGEDHDEPLDEGRGDDEAEEQEDGLEDRSSRAARSPLPDPMDRTWVHPTEFAAITPGLGPGDRPPPPSRTRRAARWLAPMLAGAAGALLTLGVLAATGALNRSSSDTGSKAAAQQSTSGADATSLPEAATTAGLSVVAVAARDEAGTRRGSAVCIRHDGDMLTSAQLVGRAKSVDVITSTGQRLTARVVGKDATTDLVLLSVEGSNDVPAAQLADHMPGTGSRVWVVGAALSAPNVWASSGMVSSNDAIVMNKTGPQTAGLVETDAASGAAATGGALVNDDGDVVGIVLGRVGSSDTTYAVPIDDATSIAQQLHADGTATHGSAGFTGTDSMFGPAIASVVDDGPAAKAGLKKGDIVTGVGGRPVESISDVLGIVRARTPGTKLTFAVQRGGDNLTMAVLLGSERG